MKEGPRVYCAGPLFSDKQKEEMQQLADALHGAGFGTFLPQRDGLEFTNCVDVLAAMGISRAAASRMTSKAIFALDVYQLLSRCGAVVVNLNGRVPDEGAVAEAAMAWAYGKAVVGYKTDTYSVFGGEQNPLVVGLFGFELADGPERAAEWLKSRVDAGKIGPRQQFEREEEISESLKLGAEIWNTLSQSRRMEDVAAVISARANTATSATDR